MDLIISTIDVVPQRETTFPKAFDVRLLVSLVKWIADPFEEKVLSTISFKILPKKGIDLLSTVLMVLNSVIDIDRLPKVQVLVEQISNGPYCLVPRCPLPWPCAVHSGPCS